MTVPAMEAGACRVCLRDSCDDPAHLDQDRRARGRRRATLAKVDEIELGQPPREEWRCRVCASSVCADPEHHERDDRERKRKLHAAARPALPFYSVAELAARVAAAGPRRFLFRGLWPAGDYGVHAAEPKAQKTWNTVDAGVAVASGTPWLGFVAVDVDPGAVLIFAGEGGEGNILRRLRATAEARGLRAEDLPIAVCPRAPHLTDQQHLRAMEERIQATSPRLVVLDPLYLSLGGANLGDLYGMGELLERPQRMCADAGASLWVTTHFNRKEGRGAARILGSGPSEWGRVLIAGTVVSRHRDAATKTTDVVVDLDVTGGEIADQTLRLRRRIWADDPDNLDSPLHLETQVEEIGEAVGDDDDKLPPAARKLLDALDQGSATAEVLVDRVVRQHGHGLRRETASRMLNDLRRRGLAEEVEGGPFKAKTWQRVGEDDAAA